MDKGKHYNDYIGHGIDKAESPQESISPNYLKPKIRNAENNPRRPFDEGGAAGKEGGILAAGENNQQSDKDKNDKGGTNWINRTGMAPRTANSAIMGGLIGKASDKGRGAGKIGGAAKKAVPASSIIIALVMCILLALGSSSLIPFLLVSNLQSKFDPLDIAAAVRSKVLTKSIMSGKNTKGGIWSKFSDYMKVRFEQTGVKVVSDGDTESLVAVDSNGKNVEIDATNYDAASRDSDIHTKLSNASSTYNSSVPLNHDSQSENVDHFLGISRYAGDAPKTDNYKETETHFNEDAEAELDGATGQMGASVEEAKKEETKKMDEDGDIVTDKNGNPVMETVLESEQRVNLEIDSDEDIDNAVKKFVEDSMTDADGKAGSKMDFSLAGKIVSGTCQLYNTVTSINRMVKAYEAAQVVVMAMRTLRTIQRAQAGDGADMQINVVHNYITREKTTTFDFGVDGKATVTGSVVNSAPIAAVFGGPKLTSEDPTVKAFVTSQGQFRKIFDKVGSGGADSYKACVGAQLIASIIDIVGDTASLGTGKIISLLAGIAIGATLSLAIGTIVSIMVPKITNALKRDYSAFLEGPEGSSVLAWGSEQIMGENAKQTAMQPATPKTLNAYIKMKQEVIADRARYDRENLSPFDASSQYTFVGSLMRSLSQVSLKTDSIAGRVGSIISVVGQSLISLTPAANAYDAINEIVSEGDYPEINNINGDHKYASAYGTPLYVSDYTTMSKDPEDVMQYWADRGAFDNYDPINNPNPPISSNENELKLCNEEYINRGAEIGFPDAAIEAKSSKLETDIMSIDSILGAIPVVGGLIDVINDVTKYENADRILGSKYTEDTEENHMCERYALDQRLGVAMGIYEENQVSVYAEKYLNEHPLDNSPLGIIARRSGLTKDEVQKDIAMINGLLFIADYNPEGLGPFVLDIPQVTIESTGGEKHPQVISVFINIITDTKNRRSQTITA